MILKEEEGDFFFFQSAFHRHLFNLYGKEAILLDSTNKIANAAISFFFIVVPTNETFQVAGFFLTTSETKKAIKEGLKQFKMRSAWSISSWRR